VTLRFERQPPAAACPDPCATGAPPAAIVLGERCHDSDAALARAADGAFSLKVEESK